MITTKCIGLVTVLKSYTVTSVRIAVALELTTTTTSPTLPPVTKGGSSVSLPWRKAAKATCHRQTLRCGICLELALFLWKKSNNFYKFLQKKKSCLRDHRSTLHNSFRRESPCFCALELWLKLEKQFLGQCLFRATKIHYCRVILTPPRLFWHSLYCLSSVLCCLSCH